VSADHSEKREAVLANYGLERASLAVIGADRADGSLQWHVTVAGHLGPQAIELDAAERLEADLRRIGEVGLANRLAAAVATAKRQTRTGSI
jgi:hypothetical protein